MMNSELQSVPYANFKKLLRSIPEVTFLGEVRDQRFERLLDAGMSGMRFMECSHRVGQATTQKDKP